MGMAASQARLLCITARIHDVEYQAQSIQNAKIQLATQEDQAYQAYNDALNATTLTINAIDPSSGEKATLGATFNNLCSRKRVTPADGNNYAIRNNQGLLVVEDEIEEGYYEFTNAGLNDPYQFALFMMNGGNVQHIGNLDDNQFSKALEASEESVYSNLPAEEKSSKLDTYHEKLLGFTNGGDDIYDSSVVSEENIDEYEETLAAYRKELYKHHAGSINANVNEDNSLVEDMDMSLFNYYVSIYNQIRNCGGCVSIEEYDGLQGDAANDTEWLQCMVQSGQFSIEIVNEDKKTGEIDMDATSPSSDTCLGYTATTRIDNRALAKAEAEYEHKLKQIDKKDQQFDLDLSKLETERTALTTEYESVKKVIDENIERTFGIFS